MIRIRRIRSKNPLKYAYEVEVAPHDWPETAKRTITGSPVAVLEPILGVGDAWSFVHEADRQWSLGNRGWAVEFEEELGN